MLNRNLAAQQFVSHVQQHGGATMDTATGRILPPRKRVYAVGGASDNSGQRIPTKYVPQKDFNAETVMHHWDHLREATGASVHMGAWSDNGNVEMDASHVYKSKHAAVKQGYQRGEKAIWANHRGNEVDTSSDASTARVRKDLN